MRIRNFQPTQYPANRHTVIAKLAVAALAGMVVNLKAGTTDEFELSDGKAGFFLDKDVVANKAALQALIEANELRPNKAEFELPDVAGAPVAAQDFAEIEIEGSALDASMDGTVTVDTQVTTAAGKIAKLTDSEAEECLGVVRRVADDVNGTGKRFTIQIMRSAKVIPAA